MSVGLVDAGVYQCAEDASRHRPGDAAGQYRHQPSSRGEWADTRHGHDAEARKQSSPAAQRQAGSRAEFGSREVVVMTYECHFLVRKSGGIELMDHIHRSVVIAVDLMNCLHEVFLAEFCQLAATLPWKSKPTFTLLPSFDAAPRQIPLTSFESAPTPVKPDASMRAFA